MTEYHKPTMAEATADRIPYSNQITCVRVDGGWIAEANGLVTQHIYGNHRELIEALDGWTVKLIPRSQLEG